MKKIRNVSGIENTNLDQINQMVRNKYLKIKNKAFLFSHEAATRGASTCDARVTKKFSGLHHQSIIFVALCLCASFTLER